MAQVSFRLKAVVMMRLKRGDSMKIVKNILRLIAEFVEWFDEMPIEDFLYWKHQTDKEF